MANAKKTTPAKKSACAQKASHRAAQAKYVAKSPKAQTARVQKSQKKAGTSGGKSGGGGKGGSSGGGGKGGGKSGGKGSHGTQQGRPRKGC